MFRRHVNDNTLYLIMLITLAVISLWVYKLAFWSLGELWHLLTK